MDGKLKYILSVQSGVKLGDNEIGEAILELVTIEVRLKNVPNYQCAAAVFDIPEEFDCVLGMPYFVDVQPSIDWRRRCFKSDVQVGASTMEASTPLGKGRQANGSGLHEAVGGGNPSAISHDSGRAAVPETRSEDEVESVERPPEERRKLSK
ncbi:unnamed protein product [Phytophthora fragariaefolia]|uniref:Unnamed protein product n=1 Tax=Phytophthora fragariaefolia TaxID=1490495 RepID=A0A9W6TM35_9STRA|nr:unnamed protein product [Phytophthora fragariaefolia]